MRVLEGTTGFCKMHFFRGGLTEGGVEAGTRAHGPWAPPEAGSVREPGTPRAPCQFGRVTRPQLPKPSPSSILLCTQPPPLWKRRVRRLFEAITFLPKPGHLSPCTPKGML